MVYKTIFTVTAMMEKDNSIDAEMTLLFAIDRIKDDYGWFVDNSRAGGPRWHQRAHGEGGLYHTIMWSETA
jgi:hypothetical protein